MYPRIGESMDESSQLQIALRYLRQDATLLHCSAVFPERNQSKARLAFERRLDARRITAEIAKRYSNEHTDIQLDIYSKAAIAWRYRTWRLMQEHGEREVFVFDRRPIRNMVPKPGENCEAHFVFADEAWLCTSMAATVLKLEVDYVLLRVYGVLATEDIWCPLYVVSHQETVSFESVMKQRIEILARVERALQAQRPMIVSRSIEYLHGRRCFFSKSSDGNCTVRTRINSQITKKLQAQLATPIEIRQSLLHSKPAPPDEWSCTWTHLNCGGLPVVVMARVVSSNLQMHVVRNEARYPLELPPSNDFAWLNHKERIEFCLHILKALKPHHGIPIINKEMTAMVLPDGAVAYRGLVRRQWLCRVHREGARLRLEIRHAKSGLCSTPQFFSENDWTKLGLLAPLAWLSIEQARGLAVRMAELGLIISTGQIENRQLTSTVTHSDETKANDSEPTITASVSKFDESDSDSESGDENASLNSTSITQPSSHRVLLRVAPEIAELLIEKRHLLGSRNTESQQAKFSTALLADSVVSTLYTRVKRWCRICQRSPSASEDAELLSQAALIDARSQFSDGQKLSHCEHEERVALQCETRFLKRLSRLTAELSDHLRRRLLPNKRWLENVHSILHARKTAAIDTTATSSEMVAGYSDAQRQERIGKEAALTSLALQAIAAHDQAEMHRERLLELRKERSAWANFVTSKKQVEDAVRSSARNAAKSICFSPTPTLVNRIQSRSDSALKTISVTDHGDTLLVSYEDESLVVQNCVWKGKAGIEADNHWTLTKSDVRRQLAFRVAHWCRRDENNAIEIVPVPLSVTAALIRRSRAPLYAATLLDAGQELVLVSRCAVTGEHLASFRVQSPLDCYPLLAPRWFRRELLRHTVEIAALNDVVWGVRPFSEIQLGRSRRDELVLRLEEDPCWRMPTTMTKRAVKRQRERLFDGRDPDEPEYRSIAPPKTSRNSRAASESYDEEKPSDVASARIRDEAARKIAKGVALAIANPKYRGALDALLAEKKSQGRRLSKLDLICKEQTKNPGLKSDAYRRSQKRIKTARSSYDQAISKPSWSNLSFAVKAWENDWNDGSLSSEEAGNLYACHAEAALTARRPDAALQSARKALTYSQPYKWRLLLIRALVSNGEAQKAREGLSELFGPIMSEQNNNVIDRELMRAWTLLCHWKGPDHAFRMDTDESLVRLRSIAAAFDQNQAEMQKNLDQKSLNSRHSCEESTEASMSNKREEKQEDAEESDYEWVSDDDSSACDDVDIESDLLCGLAVMDEDDQSLPPLELRRSEVTIAGSLRVACLKAVDAWCLEHPGVLKAKQADALEHSLHRAARSATKKYVVHIERVRAERHALVSREEIRDARLAVIGAKADRLPGRLFGRAQVHAVVSVEECEERPDPPPELLQVSMTAMKGARSMRLTEVAPFVEESKEDDDTCFGFDAWIQQHSCRFFLENDPIVNPRDLAQLLDVYRSGKSSSLSSTHSSSSSQRTLQSIRSVRLTICSSRDDDLLNDDDDDDEVENDSSTLRSSQSGRTLSSGYLEASVMSERLQDYPLLTWELIQTTKVKAQGQNPSFSWDPEATTVQLPPPLETGEWPSPYYPTSKMLPHWSLIIQIWSTDLKKQCLGEARLEIADLLAMLQKLSSQEDPEEPVTVTLPLRLLKVQRGLKRARGPGATVDIQIWPPPAWSVPQDKTDQQTAFLHLAKKEAQHGERIDNVTKRNPPRIDRPGVYEVFSETLSCSNATTSSCLTPAEIPSAFDTCQKPS